MRIDRLTRWTSATVGACALGWWRVPQIAAQTPVIDGPAPPVAPDVVTRDSAGRATVRAIRFVSRSQSMVDSTRRYCRTTPSVSDFLQQVPKEGCPPPSGPKRGCRSIATRCHLRTVLGFGAARQVVANELRRDTNQLRQNDTFGVILDTFYDRRNGYLFYTNPLRGSRGSGRYR